MILDSSMVEHTAVNRVVVGSSPTRGVIVPKRRCDVYLRYRQSRKLYVCGIYLSKVSIIVTGI